MSGSQRGQQPTLAVSSPSPPPGDGLATAGFSVAIAIGSAIRAGGYQIG